MSSLPVLHLFLFPLWQGMLPFQENSTSLRTANTNNFFLRCDFPWGCDFIIWREWQVGIKESLECTFPSLGHQLASCFGYCSWSFPILWLLGDPGVKQNGKFCSHSLWVRSPGNVGKVRGTSVCSWHTLKQAWSLNILAWSAFDTGTRWIFWNESYIFLKGKKMSTWVWCSQNSFLYKILS